MRLKPEARFRSGVLRTPGMTAQSSRPTPLQRKLYAAAAAAAVQASKGATPALLKALDGEDLRSRLRACCPQVAALSAPELLRELRAEAAASEWVHSFCAAVAQRHPERACVAATGRTSDVSLRSLEEGTHFRNQWELGADNVTTAPYSGWDYSNAFWMERAEVGIIGYPALANFDPAEPIDARTAASRPVYTALNLQRVDLGFPLLGDVTAVFRHRALRSATVVSAVDTGLAESLCNQTGGVPPGWPPHRNCTVVGCECTAWRGRTTLGVHGHLDHVLLGNSRFWQPSGADLGASLQRAFAPVWWNGYGRQPNASAAAPPPLALPMLRAEIEPEVLATLAYGSIKLVVASFQDLFGCSAYGARLRRLCAARGWALAWALGAVGTARSASVAATYDQRILDPDSAALTRLTPLPSPIIESYRALWREATCARGANATTYEWRALWRSMTQQMPTSLRLRPINARDECAVDERIDDCVGVNVEGACVCYTPAPSV